jgi:RNA polymerase sigma-70 factor, ECF subfamily
MWTVALLAASSEEHTGGPASRMPELLGMPEHEFVARLRVGDEQAYGAMYRIFYPRLVAVATAYVDGAVAEELAQDVLALVWERRETWAVDEGIGLYLYAAVRNRALKSVRHDRVVARLEHLPESSDAPPGMGRRDDAADTQLERADVRGAIDAALARLSEAARTAFLLRWMHDLSYPEIARIMATSEVTVRQQVAKARRAVVPVLERLSRES